MTQNDKNPWLLVVPARLLSTRLERKPLQLIGNIPMIVRVYKNLTPLLTHGVEAVVATDAKEIMEVCERHQIPAVMTSTTHQSGTDRCAEVAKQFSHPLIMNIQGDEPFLHPDDIKALMLSMNERPKVDLGSLVYRCDNPELVQDPNVVKAVRAQNGRAIYFSRAPVPYDRQKAYGAVPFWLHLGVYAFRRERLLEFVSLPESPLEQLEKLEQLRAVDQNWHIHLEIASHFARGIDTPEDLESARAKFR